jgi:cobaltochelatase CobT
MRNNIDGECIEVAARRLLSRRETGKVMIVLSDGMPACHTDDSHALNKHLKDTVQAVMKAGVNVVGIGIQSDAVKKFYPKSCVIHSVSELPDRVMKELRHLLVS